MLLKFLLLLASAYVAKGDAENSIVPASRMNNGQFAEHGEMPFLVHLASFEKEVSLEILCAGSLIGEKFILTAADCVNSPTFGFVLVSYENPKTNFDTGISVMKNMISFNDEVALILIKDLGDENSYSLKQISLPKSVRLRNGETAYVTGWSQCVDGTYFARYLEVKVWDKAGDFKCSQKKEMLAKLNTKMSGYFFVKDADLGAPLSYKNRKLIGIRTGSNDGKSSFAAVECHLKWIEDAKKELLPKYDSKNKASCIIS